MSHLQCSTVNFVAGSIPPPSVCINVTGLSAVYTTDAALSNLPATATATSSVSVSTTLYTGTGTGTGTSTSTSTTTAKPSDAMTIRFYDGLSSLMWLVMITSVTLVMSLL
jgi:hypothetical protein